MEQQFVLGSLGYLAGRNGYEIRHRCDAIRVLDYRRERRCLLRRGRLPRGLRPSSARRCRGDAKRGGGRKAALSDHQRPARLLTGRPGRASASRDPGNASPRRAAPRGEPRPRACDQRRAGRRAKRGWVGAACSAVLRQRLVQRRSQDDAAEGAAIPLVP